MAFIVKSTPRKSDGEKRFTLRMDSGLFDQIAAIAKEHRRSTAKEIEEAVYLYVEQFLEDAANDQINDD